MSTPIGLISIRQREWESSYDYIKWFHTKTLNTKNLKDDWATDAFIMGVSNEDVQYSFTDNISQSLADLYEMAHKFAETNDIKSAPFGTFQREDR